jgi:glycosyltransferase involved in cell wall biosynthesis
VHSQHFILIGNYRPDGQESMLRFTELLADGLRNCGMTVEVLTPQRILIGKNANSSQGIAKWLGYVDKWILFPLTLRRIVKKRRRELGDAIRFHICDHSNAPYLAYLPKNQTGITCHDVLAIRGALGDPAAFCQASRMGVVLQHWILKHLRAADRIACVSNLTLRHLCEVACESIPKPNWVVVHNSYNAEFRKIETDEAIKILERQGILLPQPFLLHVGSNLSRKNRRMLLHMIRQGGKLWPGHCCFAGDPMDDSLATEARKLGILDRIHSVPKPDHKTLCALYSLAHAFVFPSFSEGFGWPLIEAQACGTPVIASNLEPLPEVSGGAALHADPHDVPSFAAALLKLNDKAARKSLIEQGLKNAARFGLSPMIEGYLALHELRDASLIQATLKKA